MSKPKVVVVGGGLSSLMAAIRAVERGAYVEVYTLTPNKRSHSTCAQGGFNGALNTLGQGDDPEKHFYDTVYGGDFLGNQTVIRGMCYAAPAMINMFDRMGVTFNRTSEGLIDLRRAGGTKYNRVAFAGGTTGQQLMYALDEQVRRFEAKGLAKVYFPYEFLSAVIDENGVCRGIVVENNYTMEIKAVQADTVIMGTGGLGWIFGATTNGFANTGSAVSSLYQQGAIYANGEFIQIHPSAIPGEDKCRLMSETCRGEGGRLWVYKDGKPWYFLEEWYPVYKNLVPRDIAARGIYKVCVDMGLGIDGENKVYLDLTHIDAKRLDARLGGVLDIYETFVGDDPRKTPMQIFPAVHFTMGGLWVDSNQMTNIPGLFAAGECEFQWHGANRLGGNGMPACVYAGMRAGEEVMNYMEGLSERVKNSPAKAMELEENRQKKLVEDLKKMDGPENAFSLYKELTQWMNRNVTIVRRNKDLKATDDKLLELMARYKKIGINDQSMTANQSVQFARRMQDMLQISRVITIGALNRNESRGCHYKPEFPERDDENWLKTTLATYTPDGPKFDFEPVDLSYFKPVPRNYA